MDRIMKIRIIATILGGSLTIELLLIWTNPLREKPVEFSGLFEWLFYITVAAFFIFIIWLSITSHLQNREESKRKIDGEILRRIAKNN